MRLATFIIFLFSASIYSQPLVLDYGCNTVSSLPFDINLQLSAGIGGDSDTLSLVVDGVKHDVLLPQSSVSTVNENITTLDHNGSGYIHSNGFNDTEFGYHLAFDADGCLILLTWEGVQSGEKLCP